MVDTSDFTSYALNTTGLRKTTSSASASVSASASSDSIADLNASLFIESSLDNARPCRGSPISVPLNRPRAQHMGAERAPEQVLDGPRGLDQLPQLDPGIDAHLVQHRDQVLGGDVPRRPRRDRAAAKLAERRLERVHALLEGGEDIGEALAAGVVEVRGELDRGQPLARAGEKVAHLAWVGHPGRVAERDLLAAGLGQPRGDPEHSRRRHLALVRAPERDRAQPLTP